MTMSEKEFEKYLMLYGTVLEDWPEDIQAEGIWASHKPSMSALMIKQRYVDELLRNNDMAVPVSPDLADRIIRSSRRKSSVSMTAWLQELLAFVLPQPAFALATVLTLGIGLGLYLPALQTPGNDTLTQVYFEDEGTLL